MLVAAWFPTMTAAPYPALLVAPTILSTAKVMCVTKEELSRPTKPCARPYPRGKKKNCYGKVLSFGDYVVDTSVDEQAACADASLAITDYQTCKKASTKYQQVCGVKHVGKATHPDDVVANKWAGTSGCHVNFDDNHKDFFYNNNKNGEGVHNHYPVCFKTAPATTQSVATPAVAVNGRNLRSDE